MLIIVHVRVELSNRLVFITGHMYHTDLIYRGRYLGHKGLCQTYGKVYFPF